MGRAASEVDVPALGAALAATSPWTWAHAPAGAGFLAIGRAEAALHLALRTGIVPRRAAGAGIRAVAVSQALGFGAVTGAVVRWRCLPELWAAEVARLSLLATLAFAAALLLVLSAVVAGGLGPASAPAALSLGALA